MEIMREINSMVNQVEIHPNNSEKELLNICKRHNIIVETRNPIMGDQLLSNSIIQDIFDLQIEK